jgi:hypothetical protein
MHSKSDVGESLLMNLDLWVLEPDDLAQFLGFNVTPAGGYGTTEIAAVNRRTCLMESQVQFHRADSIVNDPMVSMSASLIAPNNIEARQVARVRDQVRERMRLEGLEAVVGPENFHERVTDGVRVWQMSTLGQMVT